MRNHGVGRFAQTCWIVVMSSLVGCSSPPELGKIAQDDLVRVEVTNVKIDGLNYKKKDKNSSAAIKATKSKEDVLQVVVEITNRTDSKKLNYSGWCEDSTPSKRARLTDDFGNVYALKLHPANSRLNNAEVVGHNNGSIHPGDTMSDVLVFEEPVAKATFLILELPRKTYSEDGIGVLKLRIPMDSVVK